MSAPEHTLQCSFEHPELIIGMICVGYYRKRCTNSVLLHINGVFLIVSTYYIYGCGTMSLQVCTLLYFLDSITIVKAISDFQKTKVV